MSKKSRAPTGPPPPPLTCHPSATLCDSISMTGTFPIDIGANSFLHPRCKLNTQEGPITIGSSCIINERTQLTAPSVDGLVIGDGVLVEVNSIVEAARVGTGCVIEVGSRLGKGCTLGDHCIIGPLTEIQPDETLSEHIVTYGNNQRRIDKSNTDDLRQRAIESQIQCLNKLLPNKAEKYVIAKD